MDAGSLLLGKVRGQCRLSVGGIVLIHPGQLGLGDGVDGEQIGDKHSDQDPPDEVPEDSHQQHAVHQNRCFGRQPMGPQQEPPVDDVESNLDQDPCQQSGGDLGRQRSRPQQHQQQNNRVGHPGDRSLSAGFDVDHRAHRGSCSRQTR